MTDLPTLSTALRDRVADEQPDLDRLVRSSTAAGTRLRRRRRAGTALAAVAGVAAVTVGVAALQGSGGTPDRELQVASEPATSPTVVPTPPPLPQPPTGATPVRVAAPGWTCDEPADEKFLCSADGASVVVNWRPAAERTSYLHPGKAGVLDGVRTFVSEAHGPWFATVAPAQGTTQAQVDEVGAGLVWED